MIQTYSTDSTVHILQTTIFVLYQYDKRNVNVPSLNLSHPESPGIVNYECNSMDHLFYIVLPMTLRPHPSRLVVNFAQLQVSSFSIK